jgi:hypothetical protein
MKNLLLVCSLFLLLISNSHAFSYADFVELDADAIPEDMATYSKSQLKARKKAGLSVDVYMRNFDDCDQDKVKKAKEIIELIMNSEEFKNRVLNFTYNGKKEFHQNNGLTNEEIYNLLMTGEELLMPESTGVMNFDLTLYTSKNPWSKVKGYTNPDSMRIYINRKFFKLSSWTAVDTAGNMVHEWVHKMGFSHDYRDNNDRPYSVPYAIGYIVGDIAREMGY